MKFGYARVSTLEQNPDLQVDELKKFGVEEVFVDKISGAIKKRPELDRLKEKLRSGDTVVVWKLDRLGRNLSDLIELVNYFDDMKVSFKSMNEQIDTSTSTGRLIFQIFASLAEFERNIIKERTLAGLAAARARGRQGGRPKKLTQDKINRINELYKNKSMTVKEICAWAQISKPTLYKYLSK